MPIDSSRVLKELGYDYVSYIEKKVEPERVKETFQDILPGLKASDDELVKRIRAKRLFKHQLQALDKLEKGFNVILRSGTGSGKTEAWLLYVLKHKKKTLAVYPTLALANDQLRRITCYANALGVNVVALDAKKRDELRSKLGGTGRLKAHVRQADILITNPAFLLHELKKWAINPRAMIMLDFLRSLEVLVLDEFDFYGPREIALLLSMVKLLRDLSQKKFQVVILTATLANAKEVANFLTEVLGNPSAVIEGKAFRVENRVYLVLGKNLKEIWQKAKEDVLKKFRDKIPQDVAEALEKYETFKQKLYHITGVLEALGYPLPRPHVDPCEVIGKYLNDEGVTLVFTRSISRAEEIARKLRNMYPDYRDKVASHHHLISKAKREEVEEQARRGTIKVLISPRTLSQGIDIGTVIRVVHIGLPESLREFKQREGRKGRREEIEFTETVIIPSGRWDSELLSRGLTVLEQWLNLPLEKTIVNPMNKYSVLFEALMKFISPHLRDKLTPSEYEFLRNLGLVKGSELTRRGKSVWEKLNFYEFSPPYGIKRIKRDDGKEYYLEDISHCDLVEKFQPGCFDYTSDSIVVEHRLGGRGGRMVTAVIEEKLSEPLLWRYEHLAEALEEYKKIKRKWGETPSFLRDYNTGRLFSEVLCVVYPPRSGFGYLVKIPNRVTWRIKGEKPEVYTISGRTIIFHKSKVIPVPTATYGKYNDYTYGATFEVEPQEDLRIVRLGLAFLMILLRRIYGIAFETIMYDLVKIGDRKLFTLHEPESAGLLEMLNWHEVRKSLEEFTSQEIDEILLLAVDENAYSDFLTYGLNWEIAKRACEKVLEYILLKETIRVKIRDKVIAVKKPSPALKLASFDIIELPVVEDLRVSFFCLGAFDGEKTCVCADFKEFFLTEDVAREVEFFLSTLLNRGFKVLVFSYDQTLKNLEALGLSSLQVQLAGLKALNRIIEVKALLKEALGLELLPLEELEKALNLPRRHSLKEVSLELEDLKRKLGAEPRGKWRKMSRRLAEIVKGYLEDNLRNIYLLYLIAEEMRARDEKA